MEQKQSLREKIEHAKAEAANHSSPEWKWLDEDLPWAIQDYHGSVGSVMDFTPDDWLACKENGWLLYDVCILCGEPWFCQEANGLCSYLNMVLEDWKQTHQKWTCADEEVSREAVLSAVENFYTWRKELLPKIKEIYHNG